MIGGKRKKDMFLTEATFKFIDKGEKHSLIRVTHNLHI